MKNLKRVLSYSRPYWWRILISAVASMLVGGMDGAFAYLSGPVLKRVFTSDSRFLLGLLPLGIIVIFLVRGIGRYINEYFIRTAGQLAIQDIRNDLYQRTMLLDLGYFHRHKTGTLMSRVLNDVTMMQEGAANVITSFFRDGFGALFLLGMSFYLNWRLAMISFLVIPATIYPAQKIGSRIKKVSKQGQEQMGDLSSVLQESFSGVKVIKAFSLESFNYTKFESINREFYRFMRKSIKYAGISTPVMELLTSFGVAGVIWFGGYQVVHGTMKTEALLSFIAAMILLYNPVKKLSNSYNILQRSMGAAERVFEALDEKPEIVDPDKPVEIVHAEGNVTFDNVWFSYGKADEWVLKEISLDAKKGEIIALVGQSGGGKSTMVSLISRFYDVSRGSILIDGIDIRSLKLRVLMNQIALVDQETFLFNDTIAGNIRYGKPGATDGEVESAARAAFAHDFITEMPDGYQTRIGDRGVRLSGGQRQRISIARAILKNAPILILDEATSALDTESEQMVQKALNNLMVNRTTFVIAHRLSTIIHADRIAVLDNGLIVETGNHDALLAKGGAYKKLHDMQFRDR